MLPCLLAATDYTLMICHHIYIILPDNKMPMLPCAYAAFTLMRGYDERAMMLIRGARAAYKVAATRHMLDMQRDEEMLFAPACCLLPMLTPCYSEEGLAQHAYAIKYCYYFSTTILPPHYYFSPP